MPLFMQFRYFSFLGFNENLINTYAPITLLSVFGMGLRSGLYIFIYRQFFRGLPMEIEEAALIDGAGEIRTFFTVMLPNASSAIITVAMFSFVWQYNDTFYASMFMTALPSLPSQLSGLFQSFYTNPINYKYDIMMTQMVVEAGVLLAIIPILTVYLVMQRFFMEGIERSGIVG